MRRLPAVLALALLLAAGGAVAQTFYKWIDAAGKVQYSDRPPKDFKGAVERIEVEPSAPPRVVAPAIVPPKAETRGADEGGKAEAPVDLVTKRRALRAKLQADVDAARERVDAARKALEEGSEPQPEERQAIQQRLDKAGNTGPNTSLANADATQNRVVGGGMHGMAARSNCRSTKDARGKVAVICPTMVLKEEYFSRQEKLEEALRKAEEELAAAEEAYRRGVD